MCVVGTHNAADEVYLHSEQTANLNSYECKVDEVLRSRKCARTSRNGMRKKTDTALKSIKRAELLAFVYYDLVETLILRLLNGENISNELMQMLRTHHNKYSREC